LPFLTAWFRQPYFFSQGFRLFSGISIFAVLGFSALLLVVSGFTLTAFFQFLAGEVLAVQQSSKWPGFPHNTSLKPTHFRFAPVVGLSQRYGSASKFRSEAQLLCNVFGFGGPGLGSLRALGSQRLT